MFKILLPNPEVQSIFLTTMIKTAGTTYIKAICGTFGFRLANGAFGLWGALELLIDLWSLNPI